VPHQRGVAARAQRQCECVEQDRLASSGLAREHGEALGKINVEPIDQDNVADRKPNKHKSFVSPCPGLSRGIHV
jgi:hypothetical protein